MFLFLFMTFFLNLFLFIFVKKKQAFQPYLKLFLVPLVEIASSPRGYAQIRAEAEKGVVLLMAEKRLFFTFIFRLI